MNSPPESGFYDYDCYWLDLLLGLHSVRHEYRVDADYFDFLSGWRLPELERHAKQMGAEVWLGTVHSNSTKVFLANQAPPSWSSTVVQLAESLYNGQHCSFALHDALLEAGHAELAEHFKEKEHPKGCWAIDLILGKK
jgi:hypothetical protein